MGILDNTPSFCGSTTRKILNLLLSKTILRDHMYVLYYARELYKSLVSYSGSFWEKKGITSYNLGRTLVSQGGCSRVYFASEKSSGLDVAIKMIPFKTDKLLKKQFINETTILNSLLGSHYIVQTKDTFMETGYGFIVMKLAKTDVHSKYIENFCKLDQQSLKYLFYQACNAVFSCHRQGIVHLDIKPENLLIDSNGDILLCDFGMAVKLNDIPDYISQMDFGTCFYCAPEIQNSRDKCNIRTSADIWSLGILLFLLVCRTFPFEGNTEAEMIKNYKNCRVSLKALEDSNISTCGKFLIKDLLQINPKHRPTIKQILQHPWFLSLKTV